LTLDWPGPTIVDGNGTSQLYIDDAADTNQQKELEDLFQGRQGEPYADVSITHSKMADYSKDEN
jgi:hypothetical protein